MNMASRLPRTAKPDMKSAGISSGDAKLEEEDEEESLVEVESAPPFSLLLSPLLQFSLPRTTLEDFKSSTLLQSKLSAAVSTRRAPSTRLRALRLSLCLLAKAGRCSDGATYLEKFP
jgi:hypothetical protein